MSGPSLFRISHPDARQSSFVSPDCALTLRRVWHLTAKMAQSNWQKLKNRWNAETKDEEELAAHLRLVRAVGLFAGSVFLMRNFGDLMAI